MLIKHLTLRGLHGFSLKLDFGVENCLVGANGSGKTTILKVVAALTGNDSATYLISGLNVEECLLQVEGVPDLVIRGRFDADQINEYKRTLPARSSFVLLADGEDDRFLYQPGMDAAGVRRASSILKRYGLVPWAPYNANGVKYQPPGSAQQFVTRMFERIPSDESIPILFDIPERHLSHDLKRTVVRDVFTGACDPPRQIIYATHSPEVIARFVSVSDSSKGEDGVYREGHRALFDMESTYIK